MISIGEQSQVILVVEDNPDDYEATERALKKSGIRNEIRHCVDGDDALDYLFREGEYSDPEDSPRPGLILLDLNLPGTDGREVLHELKSDEKLRNIPVIVLTTSTDERDIEACYAAGANSYMNKRINLVEFVQAIQRLTDFWLEIAILPK